MKALPPLYAVVNEFRYVENHAGIPIRIRAFMIFSRTVTYWLLCTPFVGIVGIVRDGPVAWLAWAVFWGLSIMQIFPNTRIDIFLPLGFRLFKGLITVR